MLARHGQPAGSLDYWAVEPKLDGWRAMVLADPSLPGGVIVRTRRDKNITHSVPGIEALAGLRVVLDGELIADAGRASDFYRLAPRLSSRRFSGEIAFMAFDVLWHDGELTVHRTYEERRQILEGLELASPCLVVPRFAGSDAPALFIACAEQGVEGVVLKRLTSIYKPGERSSDWRKVKDPTWKDDHLKRRRPR